MWLRRHGIGSSNGCGTPWSSSSKSQSALKVIHQLEEVLKSMPSGAMAAEVEKEVTYLREHQDRMDYWAGARRGEVTGKIQKVVEQTAGGPVSHIESAPVLETFQGKTIWKGIVEVFRVQTPPPLMAYGWAVEGDHGPDYVAVLGTPPIDSPIAAVRAWIVSQGKK
jgi:hypothetical protein